MKRKLLLMLLLLVGMVSTRAAYEPVGEGQYYLYNVTKGMYVNSYNTQVYNLSSEPTTYFTLTSSGTGTYTIMAVNGNANGKYLKLGYYDELYLWADGTTGAEWTFAEIESTKTYQITANGVTVNENGVNETGNWRLYYCEETHYSVSGQVNASTSSVTNDSWALVRVDNLVNFTASVGDASGTENNTTKATQKWTRTYYGGGDSDYSVTKTAVNSAVYSGAGIQHWNSTAQTGDLIHQTIANLPAGNYRLTAYAAAQKYKNDTECGGNTADKVYLMANDTKVAVNSDTYANYVLDFTLDSKQDVKIGLWAADGNDMNWLFLSNVHLFKLDGLPLSDTEAYTNLPCTGNVTIGRSFSAGFNSICLPFALTQAQIESQFGAGTKVYTLTGETENSTGVYTLNFTEGTTLAANTPAIIKVTTAKANPTFSDVTIGEAATPTASTTNFDFVGVYTPGTVPTGDWFVRASDGKLVKATTNNTINAFRAYIAPKTAEARQLSISFSDESTGISATLNDKGEMISDKFIYNLSGQRVSQPTRGLYIVGGKKVMVK